jgi:hypothetical protein
MSSLDMVAYINATRKPGEAELLHFSFLAKVPQVLKDAKSFLSNYLDSYGRQQPCYNFPRREATFMAMSYSYELQQTVYDAWQEAEAKLVAQAPVALIATPATYLDALKQLVASVEVQPWIRWQPH